MITPVPEAHRQSTEANPLTIVSYHYVRPIAGSRYPAMKALDAGDFRRQLAYFRGHYHFVSIENVVAAAEEHIALPERPLLLTFDDGYMDHYTHAFPILREFGARGAFYPPTCAVLEHRVLDVNKIHFILASIPEPAVLIDAIEDAIRAAGQDTSVRTVEEYREHFWISNRFDPPPVLYCKQLLQHALPDLFRRQLVDALFHRFVTRDEASFAADLYVGVEQLQTMLAGGMHVGGHGGSHCWLDRLTLEEQRSDIEDSFRLLDAIGIGRNAGCFTFCYPYGGYNADTLQLLRERQCKVGLTVRVELAHVERDRMLELPRLDTTDFPTDPDAAPGHWTALAQAPQRRLPAAD
jgi:peptidoglycan/xylan/chitin deacetylase (PgdA/CDA1 family)